MYIVFEGIAWAWKSTQSKKLVEFLQKKFPDKKILHVHEPGSTPIAQDIRTLAQAKTWDDDFMHPLTNAYLYAASRAQLIHTKLIPELYAGTIIVSDRSFLSSLAYQGEAQRLGFDKVMSINADAIEDLIPDIVLYIDTNIDTAMNRVFDAKGDKWETMGRQFYLDTQRGYEKCAQLEMLEGRFFRINWNRDSDDVAQQIKSIINDTYDKIGK
mgnify:CR=1 FL=1